MASYTVHAISSDELDRVRSRGGDDHGNQTEPFVSGCGHQLRCCLRLSRPGEALLLIAHAPLTTQRSWTDIGPVLVHAKPCRLRPLDAALPAFLVEGPRVLRPYTADGSLYHQGITITAVGDNLDALLTVLFTDPNVAEVHVRNLSAHCFILRVAR